MADAKFWDKIADKYSRKPVENIPAFERKIAITKEHLTPESVILEIGCGTGSLALELAPHLAHIHALDISAEMLKIAKGKFEAKGLDNITFHQSTLDQLTALEPGSLDGVCAYSILHLVDDRIDTLRRLFALLKPGGFLISSTVCLGASLVPYKLIIGLMRLFGKAPVVHSLKPAQLVADIKGAGFVDISQPDVGAEKIVAFIVAKKPSSESPGM